MSTLEAGDRLEAEAIVARAARDVAMEKGADSAAYAAAEFDHAHILIALGDLRRGADAIRRAAKVPAKTDEERKLRLTYLMNLGEALLHLGSLDESEEVLRQGLSEREELYGKEHPGTAFGLEPLADLLLTKGKSEEALDLSDRASAIFWSTGHPRVAQALALRAFAVKEHRGADSPALEKLYGLPAELVDVVVTTILERAPRSKPAAALAVLDELRAQAIDHGASDAPWMMHVVATLSTIARAAGQQAIRRQALEWLVERFDAVGDERQALSAVLGLALAHSESGDDPASDAGYAEARRRAELLADPIEISGVLRNHGLFYSERDRRPEAARILEESVAFARRADDGDPSRAEAIGRSLIALGIFRQHGAELDVARAMLEEALSLLPVNHPDTLYARSHLHAIVEGGSCGCGDPSAALSDALRALVLPHAPPGLLEDLELVLGDDLDVRVKLSRSPTPAESELLDRVIHLALVELRQIAGAGRQPPNPIAATKPLS